MDAPDLERRVHGGEWTIADATAHVVCMFRAFTAAVAGETAEMAARIPALPGFHERLAAANAAMLQSVERSSGVELARALRAAQRLFARVTRSLAPSTECETPWYGAGMTRSIETLTGLSLAETTIHGYDIARAAGRPWYIAPEVARIIVGEVFPAMFPLLVDPQAAAGVNATFALHLRHAAEYAVRVDGGRAMVVRDLSSVRADCHLSADPVAFMLVGYGRKSQWPEIPAGNLVSWGRKPWLALRFRSLFVNP